MVRFHWLLPFLALAAYTSGAQSPNLARSATATASEAQSADLAPAKAIDGDEKSRWSGIPGHNSGVWFELDWDKPVAIAEVVVHQYERYCFEWDVQTWDDAAGAWVDAGHYGKAGVRLPLAVVCQLAPSRTTRKLRIANITNGPSFTEVEVYDSAHEHKPVITMASDLQGNFVGMLCDAFGGAPLPGRPITIKGASTRGPWLESAKSDEHGLFFAPMPIGMTGAVSVSSPEDGAHHYFADSFQRAITPISINATVVPIATGWRFMINPPSGFSSPGFNDSDWASIKVPGHWAMQGFKGDNGGYRVHFPAPAGDGRLMLRFDGVYSGADVWLNGHHIASHEGGFTPFEADITDLVKPKGNVLVVQVAEHTNVSDNLDKMSQYADFPLGGIMRKVTLFRVPDVHVEALQYRTEFSADATSAVVIGEARFVNRGATAVDRMISAHIALPNAFKGTRYTWGGATHIDANGTVTVPFRISIPKCRPWSAEQPVLYDLSITCRGDDGAFEPPFHTLIGLRQTEIKGTEILINKRPVKFRGTCHHDQYPTLGRAVTPALEKLDVRMIKEANLNSLRTSHYPPMPELLDEADRQGVYVEDEADFCWVNVSDDLRNAPRIIQLEGELLARDRNHPSVFEWSLCNESGFGYDFDRAHEFVQRTDPSRPTSAATSAWTEIATEHNPISIDRLNKVAGIDKPLLWDEAWCIYQGIFNDVAEMWVDPGMRDYYAEPLPAVYDAFMKSKTVSGSMIWAWSDDLFCVPGRSAEYGRGATRSHFVDAQYSLPGRGIVGDAPWGVVDGWRRRKPEFWITKKLQSPIRMKEVAYKVVDHTIELPIENQYDFTNLRDVNVTWSSGAMTGRASVNLAPRSAGMLRIQGANGICGYPLRVAFRDGSGRLIDAFQFPPSATVGEPAFAVSAPVKVRDESILAGDVTYVTGQGFELGFDKEHGWLRHCVAENSPLLLDSPSIHVLPTADPLNPLPRASEWHVDDFYVGTEGRTGRVVQGGHYDNFKGGYEWLVQPTGDIVIHAKFTYSGPDVLAREVGISFSLPRSCTELQWERKGEWGVYPDDHIGRPSGTAQAFYNHGSAVPPTWPWSEDDTPLGSNDFRSTKRNFSWARIGYPRGAAIEIRSDGHHAVRAIVESDRVRVFVNDWYGGTNVGWGEWISNYGRGKLIKSGDVIESTLTIRLSPSWGFGSGIEG